MASFHGHHAAGAPNKITKTRGKMVKPILKKLSHSEKNSLDLDRGWDEQQNNGWGGVYEEGSAGRAHSAKDVSFAFDREGGTHGIGGVGNVGRFAEGTTGGGGGPRKFGHLRTQSSASNGSARGGAFVHPFAQTPRTSTPPLSYANSFTSFNDTSKEYSPTITEAEDDDPESTLAQPHLPNQNHNSNPANYFPPPTHHRYPSSLSQSSLRRPSLASQRTASFTDITTSAIPQLRVNTNNRSTPSTSSRLTQGILHSSQSDLQLNLSLNDLDSPTGSLGGVSFVGAAPPSLTSPTSSASAMPLSPLRSSLEGFRVRSKSDMDSTTRAENIREARRKFEERERVKEAKYESEMIRKRERKDNKEAIRKEKEAAQWRKNNPGGSSSMPEPLFVSQHQHPVRLTAAAATASASTAARRSPPTKTISASVPVGTSSFSASRLNSGSASTSRNDVSSASFFGLGSHNVGSVGGGNGGWRQAANEATGEKQISFMSRDYDSVPGQTPPAFGPGVDNVHFQQTRPRKSAKKRTLGYWQGFVLWIRTKWLRIGGR